MYTHYSDQVLRYVGFYFLKVKQVMFGSVGANNKSVSIVHLNQTLITWDQGVWAYMLQTFLY